MPNEMESINDKSGHFFLGIRATNYAGQIVGHFDWRSVEEPTDVKFKTLTCIPCTK